MQDREQRMKSLEKIIARLRNGASNWRRWHADNAKQRADHEAQARRNEARAADYERELAQLAAESE
jgi:hypothetical protein